MEQRLYIIMREDIPDMNPGKGMAQAAHAQADFDSAVELECGPAYLQDDKLWSNVCSWKEDRNFGVTLVVSATLANIDAITNAVRFSGKTVDPTYPWRNYYGKMFTSEEVTCAWAFVQDEVEAEYMRKFDLHK
jgi:hypothetical protein